MPDRNAKSLLVAPSILAADFARMGEEIQQIGGADWLHIDVMDGSFVPPITFGAQMVRALRAHSELPFDVHLMVEHPETQIESFAQAGADLITFHLEACTHAHRLLQAIKALGLRAGISLVPSTPASAVSELLGEVDLILIMSVNPGYGGQSLIPQTLQKLALLAQWRQQGGYDYLLSIDGGANLDSICAIRAAGADVVVAGSAFFGLSAAAERAAFVRAMKGQQT